MDTFGYVMVAVSLVMLGFSIGAAFMTIVDNHLQQENERLKKLLRAILKIENISFEAYREMAQEAARNTQQTKLMPRRKFTDLDTPKTDKVNHLL